MANVTLSLSLRVALVVGALPLSLGACSSSRAGNPDASTLDARAKMDGRIDTGYETLGDAGDCFVGHVTNGGVCASDDDCCAVVSMGPVECVKGVAETGTCRAGAGGACSNDSACATHACDDGRCASSKLGGACGSGIDCSGLGAMCLSGTCGTFGGDAAVVRRDAAGVPPEDAGAADARDADAAQVDAAKGDAGDSGGGVPDGSAG
jgi:hypothetical protein